MSDIYHNYSQKLENPSQLNDEIHTKEDVKILESEESEHKFDKFTVPTKDMILEGEFPRNVYYGYENGKENYSVSSDHCYARPWNWKPESSFLRPTKTLFIPKTFKKTKFPAHSPSEDDNDENIDIESVDNALAPIYDADKANQLMEECERHIKLFKTDEGNDYWEETILKNNWSPTQTRLFNGIVSILNNHNLAKLASKDMKYEAVCRRTAIDKSVQRIRRLMATVFWDQKLTQWLHQLLTDHLSTEYLIIYLDILQTLKAKLPTFVDKMIYGQNTFKIGAISTENLLPLLKRPWDPVASITSNRYLKWINLLSNLATVVNVPFNLGTPGQKLTMMHCADQMFASIKGQVQEIKSEHPNKNIVLLGFNAGAAMALQVAQAEPVLAVICLGFSLLTAEGKRGEPEDTLMELQCPVLFVIGQCSTTSSQEDMEDLRERMRVETGLVVVGSADNFLRVSKKKKRAEGITQSVVDRCIVDEIGEFISGIILSPFPPQIRQSPTIVSADSTVDKKTRMERKRYNSNTSSLDSEDPLYTLPTRISRPVGRPPGSKTKSKLEVKWAAQVAQGTASQNPTNLSPNNSPPLTPASIDSSSNDSSLDKQNNEKSLPNFPSKIKTILPNSTETQPFIKKVRTLKPVVQGSSTDSFTNTITMSPSKGSSVKGSSSTGSAKMQAYGMAKHNLASSSRLSSLLQGGIKTIPPSQPKNPSSTIRVLENVTLTPSNPKILQNTGGKTLTLINSSSGMKQTGENVVILPDGKIKTIGPRNIIKGTRYITSKKQLLGNKPPKPIKKLSSYKPSSTITTTLPPPTNLTTQDIMNLPIVFADDGQILETPIQDISPPPIQNQTSTQLLAPPTSKILTPGSKFVLVNKPMNFGSNTNFMISQTPLKKTTNVYRQTPKYTKIILSKRAPTDELKSTNVISRIANLSSEISVKKISTSVSNAPTIQMENIDLENELVATTIPKPAFSTDLKNVTMLSHKIVNKQGESYVKTLEKMREERIRNITSPGRNMDDEDSDPDYIPPKMVKLN
ncbi:hypothetical protein HHI36_017240 [Cryptolaemus montrouzieri]|uniref:KANL3/Tex30 alpha/beta hydrolase-like domain-containing protein n=1 Tax=Cryptolaemus montrouzieri TaxID=559131 RepID=A0ABD2NMY6_9CUCU